MLGGGSGISRYISELSQQILAHDKLNEYVLFFNKLDEATRKTYEPFNVKLIETGIAHYSLAEQIQLPQIFNRENLDLLHVPHFNVPLLYGRKFVCTIHDLTHTKFPGKKMSHIFHRLAYNLIMLNAVKRAKKIIAVSEATRQEIMGYFRIPSEKIQVVYEGADPLYHVIDRDVAVSKIATRFGITKPYILYVGVWRRYKNLPALARVFDKLVESGIDAELVLAGQPDPFYPEIEEQVKRIVHKDRVKAIGRVSDQELMYLYNGSILFVLPSFAEGFGLTALEAASCGAPIAASDIPTMREILGQAAEYFDPKNEDNIFDVLKELLVNEQRLEELANLALSRAKHFSWPKAGQETIQVYESAK